MRSSLLLRLVKVFWLLLVLSLASTSPAAAKGAFSSVVILDLETGEAFQVSDPGLESFFALSDFAAGTPEAPTVGKGYELTRGVTRDGIFWAVDRLRYYPGGSQPNGYLFYEGLINGSGQYDGKWFATTRAGDATMARILSSSRASSGTVSPILLGVTSAAAGLVAGFALARKLPRVRVFRPA